VGTIDADHHDGGEGRQFHRHPHQANVVCDECQIHAEQHELEHCVVETQVARREAACIQLVADVAGAEGACGKADEGVQQDEHHVQIVDQQVLAGSGSVHEQKQRAEERQQAGGDIDSSREPVIGDRRQYGSGGERHQEDGEFAHGSAPRPFAGEPRRSASMRRR
jgi:hypothetical protein